MSSDSSSAETTGHGCYEGVALVHQAQDSGNWRPVVDWLVRHPECFAEVASAIGADGAVRDALVPPPAPAQVGSVLGNYELLARLGGGSMGTVYRSRDLRAPREVAVKVVNTAGLPPKELDRVRFEVEAMARMNHPNVVALLGSGEDNDVLFLAMPVLPQSLAGWLGARGPDRCLRPKQAAKLVRDIARGVHHAHQHDLIHRDLKPANVLLGDDGAPQVCDFGLARPVDLTVTTIAGSPAYMAPEQARGDSRLTAAVDVHALGAILFELLAGRVPFTGADRAAVLRRVIEELAPRVRDLQPEVPPDLDEICARCLRKEPGERYPSAQEVADDIERYLNGDPISTESRGSLRHRLRRAIVHRKEAFVLGSGHLLFWGAASTVLAMAVLQAATLTAAPLWVSQAAIAYYFAGWLGLMWLFLVARSDALNQVERISTALHFGAKFGCLAVLPGYLCLHGGDPVPALPAFMALVGLCVFAHGVFYWGRFYLVGLGFFVVAALMPLVPVTYWPTVYGALLGGLQLLSGIHLRYVHKQAETERAKLAESTQT